MQVSVLLQTKGSEVVTVGPATAIAEVVAVLHDRRIGAVVVTDPERGILGVLSERDIVRGLAERGAAILAEPASTLMTVEVVTCELDTTVDQLMATMTARRIRHVPVLADDALAGLVSIGDVVKDRIANLEHEAQAMHDYIAHPY